MPQQSGADLGSCRCMAVLILIVLNRVTKASEMCGNFPDRPVASPAQILSPLRRFRIQTHASETIRFRVANRARTPGLRMDFKEMKTFHAIQAKAVDMFTKR